MTLPEVFASFNATTLPSLDQLSRNFEAVARQHITEPEAHAFYARLGRVVHDFSESLRGILNSVTPQLCERLAQPDTRK
jgi:hypothetical protein